MSECFCAYEPTPACCPEHGVLGGAPPSGGHALLGNKGQDEGVYRSGEARPSGEVRRSLVKHLYDEHDLDVAMLPVYDLNRLHDLEHAPRSGCKHGKIVSPAICKRYHEEAT